MSLLTKKDIKEETMTADECIAAMSQLQQIYLTERYAYSQCRTKWKIKYDQTLRIISMAKVEYLVDERASAALQGLIDEARLSKATIAEREAIIHIEHKDLYKQYETAKFNSETTFKAFEMHKSTLLGHIGSKKLEIAVEKMDLGERTYEGLSKINETLTKMLNKSMNRGG